MGRVAVIVVMFPLVMGQGAPWARGDDAEVIREWSDAPVPAPKRGMDLSIPGLRAKEFAAYAAVQFGAGENDIAYLVFDCEERLKPYDVLHVFVPAHKKFSEVVQFSSRKKGAKGRVFRKLTLAGKYGKVEHECLLRISGRTQWDAGGLKLSVEANCGLRDAETKERSSFSLHGPIKVTVNSAVEIPCTRLIQKPRLDVRWDHRSAPPHVRARIDMGSLSLEPEAGFKRKAIIEVRIRDAKKPQYRRAIVIEPSGARREFCHHVRTRLRPRTEYEVNLSVDMRPFFGIIRAGDQMVLR